MNRYKISKQYKKAIDKAFKILQNPVTITIRTTRNTNVPFDDVMGEPITPGQEAYNTKVQQIQAIARWNDSQRLQRFTAGTVFEEELYLEVYANDVLKDPSDPTQGTIFEDAKSIEVDGVECKLKSTPRRMGLTGPYTFFVVLERSV